MAAAQRLCDKTLEESGTSDKVAMDKNSVNKAAIDAISGKRGVLILVRQVNCLNNIVEQDHQASQEHAHMAIIRRRDCSAG